MTFKSYLFMNYEDTVFGLDIVLAITGVGEPYLLPKQMLKQDLNINFVDLRSAQERECSYFATTFYEESVNQCYTNIYKICTIREIENGTDKIQLKDELKAEESPIAIKYEGLM